MLRLKKKPDPSPVQEGATLAGEPPAITNEASAAPNARIGIEECLRDGSARPDHGPANGISVAWIGLARACQRQTTICRSGPDRRRSHAHAGTDETGSRQAGTPLLEKLKGDPNNAALLGQIGAVYDSMHQFTEGAVYYNRAVQADPGNAVFHNKLAISLYSNGDADGAIAQLNQALAHDPGYADALFNLGMIKLQAKQDGKGALAAWQQLLKSNPKLSADRKAIVQKQIAGVETMLNNQKAPDSKR